VDRFVEVALGERQESTLARRAGVIGLSRIEALAQIAGALLHLTRGQALGRTHVPRPAAQHASIREEDFYLCR
jgi:hypothetical protein